MNALETYGLLNFQGWRMVSEQDYLSDILGRELVPSGLSSPAFSRRSSPTGWFSVGRDAAGDRLPLVCERVLVWADGAHLEGFNR